MTGMNYSDLKSALMTLLEYTAADIAAGTAFDTILPRAIEYAENRMQRDLDFLASVVADSSGAIGANSQKLTYPTTLGHFVVVSEIIPMYGGLRLRPLEPVSRPFIDFYLGTDMPTLPSSYGSAVVYKAYADSPYAIGPTDGMIVFDATAGNCIGTLPLASLYPYREIELAKDDSSSYTVRAAATGSDTIVWVGGVLIAQGQTVSLKSDGISRWIARHQVG